MYLNTPVRIPDVPNIITRKIRGTPYIYYIYERVYDPSVQYTRSRGQMIGKVLPELPGQMLPNEFFSNYFDLETYQVKPEPLVEPLPDEIQAKRDSFEQLMGIARTMYQEICTMEKKSSKEWPELDVPESWKGPTSTTDRKQ